MSRPRIGIKRWARPIIKNRWFYAGVSVVLGILVLAGSWAVSDSVWWSGVLVNAGTALLLFTPLAVYGMHVENQFDQVRRGQQKIERQQEETAAGLASLTEEVSQAQGELRRTREELADILSERLAESRSNDATTFQDVEERPSHRGLFEALMRASKLGLISRDGCRVKLRSTTLYLRFQRPEPGPFGELPHPNQDLPVQIESIDARPLRDLRWRSDQGAEDFLVELSEELIGLAQYPGDRSFGPDSVFSPLKAMLELANRSATSGSSEPLTSVIEFCPPQWVITSSHLIAVDPPYAIPMIRMRESRWHEHMREKVWLDYDSFTYAFSVSRVLFDAGKLDVKPLELADEPPF